MKSKTKRVFWGFFSLDYKAMAEYLEEMAEKGWMLEKVGRVTAKFRAIEPKKIKFSVDIFKKGGAFAPEDNEETSEYRKLCQESGWTFVTSQEYLQFFYAKEGSDPVPLQTDEEIEQKIIENTLLKRELIGVSLFLLVAVFALVRSFPVRYGNLLSFTGVASTFLFPILSIIVVIPALYGIVWMINARRRIKNGMTIKKPTLKSARRRIVAFSGIIWIIISIFAICFIVDAFFRPDDVLIAVLGPAVGISLGTGIRYFVKKGKIKGEKNVLLTVIVVAAMFFFISRAIPFIMEKSEEMYNVDSFPERYPVVTMKEIPEYSEQGRSLTKEFKTSMSPVVPKHYTYWEHGEINGIKKYMDIKYYEAINPYFSEIIFNGIIDRIEKGIKWRGMTILDRTIVTDDEMKHLWNADNLALTEERDELIIRKGNIVLRLSGDIDFNDRQTRELILERFFSDVQLKN